jgi:putative transposase
MRRARIKAENGIGCYHVMSRIVDRSFKMDAGEREIFRRILRRVEAFSGVRVFTYAILSNHFHLLIEVPEQPILDDAELLRRLTALHGACVANQYKERWDGWRKTGMELFISREQDQLRKRMGDVSPFMKLLKQLYTVSYNRRHQRTGTLWEGRYTSILVEAESRALSTVAAYIDLNPVRAGLVNDPAEYRWSGYGEACGGSLIARQGICAIHASGQPDIDWNEATTTYRTLLYTQGQERQDADGCPMRHGLSPEETQAVIDQGGKLPLPTLLRCRVRYFRDGVALGSKAFVESVFLRNRDHFGPRRRTGARRIRFCAEKKLCVARDLRHEPVNLS